MVAVLVAWFIRSWKSRPHILLACLLLALNICEHKKPLGQSKTDVCKELGATHLFRWFINVYTNPSMRPPYKSICLASNLIAMAVRDPKAIDHGHGCLVHSMACVAVEPLAQTPNHPFDGAKMCQDWPKNSCLARSFTTPTVTTRWCAKENSCIIMHACKWKQNKFSYASKKHESGQSPCLWRDDFTMVSGRASDSFGNKRLDSIWNTSCRNYSGTGIPVFPCLAWISSI